MLDQQVRVVEHELRLVHWLEEPVLFEDYFLGSSNIESWSVGITLFHFQFKIID